MFYLKKSKKIILRILTIILATFLIFGIAHIIYVQYHRAEVVEYLVDKYDFDSLIEWIISNKNVWYKGKWKAVKHFTYMMDDIYHNRDFPIDGKYILISIIQVIILN